MQGMVTLQGSSGLRRDVAVADIKQAVDRTGQDDGWGCAGLGAAGGSCMHTCTMCFQYVLSPCAVALSVWVGGYAHGAQSGMAGVKTR